MSLLLNGAKTATIAGTELQLIEIYTGESYTFPFNFTNSAGSPVNITGWTFTPTAKWYTANIAYADQGSPVDVTLTNLTLVDPQPSQPSGLTASIVSGSAGTGYLVIPTDINGGESIAVDSLPSLIAIVTLTVSRTDPLSSATDVSKEPIGLIIRYI